MSKMGYLLVGVMAIVLVVLLVVALSRGKPQGTLDNKPHVRDKPSAEEATPGASATASPEQAEQARRRTPPA
jgi:hypothetical protein